MIDLWTTMGVLATDPAIDTEIQSAMPKFTRIDVTYQWKDQASQKTVQALGEFSKVTTEGLRDRLNTFFMTKYPDFNIVVSLYCAERLCQLIAAPAVPSSAGGPDLNFLDMLKHHRSVWATLPASMGAAPKQAFAALLGIGLVDGNARVAIVNNSAALKLITGPLRFNPSVGELHALKDMISPLLAVNADRAHDPLNLDPWQVCREPFFFYAGSARDLPF